MSRRLLLAADVAAVADAGEPTPKSELPADELFEKLKPFKDLVEENEADR